MIAIRHRGTGETEMVTSLDGYGPEWEEAGAVPACNAGMAARLRLVAGAWVEDATVVEAELVAAVKAESERRAGALYSGGAAKLASYAAKRAEVDAWRQIGGAAAFNLLAPVLRAARFRYTLADAAARGDQPSAAIARFAAGMDACDAKAAAIAGIEQAAIAAIRAAAGAPAKRAAYAAISWSCPA